MTQPLNELNDGDKRDLTYTEKIRILNKVSEGLTNLLVKAEQWARENKEK